MTHLTVMLYGCMLTHLAVMLYGCMLFIRLWITVPVATQALMMGGSVVAFLHCTISMYPIRRICDVSTNLKTQISWWVRLPLLFWRCICFYNHHCVCEVKYWLTFGLWQNKLLSTWTITPGRPRIIIVLCCKLLLTTGICLHQYECQFPHHQ